MLPVVYLYVRNRHIADKARFLFNGAACCIGVRVLASALGNPLIKYLSGSDLSRQPDGFMHSVYSLAAAVVPLLLMTCLLWGVERIAKKAGGRAENIEKKDYVSYGIALAGGMIVWLAAPQLFGKAQASDSLYYPLVLFIVGLVSGLLRPGVLWRTVLAVAIGQTLGFMFVAMKDMGPLWLMGLFFILADSFAVVVGATAGSLLRTQR